MVSPVIGADNYRTIDFHEDFEAEDPFEVWASNGDYTIHSKGLTTERASSGNKSFKLDITISKGTYVYFQIPIKYPSGPDHQLSFSGDMYIEQIEDSRTTLGTNVRYDPLGFSGVNKIKAHYDPTSEWITQTSDLVEVGIDKASGTLQDTYGGSQPSDFGIWSDKIAIFLYSMDGGRITVYVDNIHITGNAPENDAYQQTADKIWDDYLTRIQNEVTIKADEILDYLYPNLDQEEEDYLSDAQYRAKEIKAICQEQGYVNDAEYQELLELHASLDCLGNTSGQMLDIYPWEPTSPEKILPSTFPVPAQLNSTVSLKACPGEFEPASFIIRANTDLTDITFQASDLKDNKGNIISKETIELHYVACWYQAGTEHWVVTDQHDLVPELLVKDPNLVQFNTQDKTNSLKVTMNGQEQYINISDPNGSFPDGAVIQDADTLQPLSLSTKTNRQIWITIHVPDSAASGEYQGKLGIELPGNQSQSVDVKLEVLPFKLEDSVLEYSIYYRGKYDPDRAKPLSDDWKDLTQYESELKNMRDHGVDNPNVYQPLNENRVKQVLSLRNEIGLPTENLYVLGTSTGKLAHISLEELLQEVVKWQSLASSYGYDQMYIYGKDEATGDKLLEQRNAWQAIHEQGAKVFVACTAEAFDLVGDLLDYPILHAGYDKKDQVGNFKPEEVAKWHSQGHRVAIYSNPQVGVENPHIYRKNFGLALWANGYDGAMNYAYQHADGHIWNDFDGDNYRDHVFAYPTTNGLINTVQWEGFREAVDDVRYLSTLVSLNGVKESEIKTWIHDEISKDTPPLEIRKQIIDKILGKIVLISPSNVKFNINE
jgi:hypothetical protein